MSATGCLAVSMLALLAAVVILGFKVRQIERRVFPPPTDRPRPTVGQVTRRIW